MKQISKLLLAACFLSCAVFMGCKDDPTDEEVLTKPVITFKDNIKEGESPVTVSATIVSDFNLKSVKIEKNFTNAANNEVVETITSFPNNPKELVYEHEFVIPDGLVKMDIKFTAVNVKDLSTEATFVITGKISITQTDIIDAMAEAYAGWEVDGTFPVELTIKGITFNKAQIFGYACQTLINLKNNQTTPLTLLNVGPCEIGDLDDYTTPEISIGAMIDQANRQLTYGSNNGIWANYASFGSYQATPYTDEYGPYQGRFSFDRATVCFARIFAAYKTSGTLPATVNADFKLIAPYSPGIVGSFTKDQLVTAIADAYNAAFGTGNSILPDNITVNGTELTKVQYFYAAARLLLYINENNPANIAVLTYLMPENPASSFKALSFSICYIVYLNGKVICKKSASRFSRNFPIIKYGYIPGNELPDGGCDGG
ncbi:MAG: hypothetical protein EZS26_002881 [Candidatus Ordinivivax streblomastigis]|uniref:Uncharacterized protein n=1 Tax=Candidatus Ordinivivax streblomastigis TaxID=2540710 RepID=A0A5M8NY30_9BACT|nr:MAG: hypothetical protein EZS26_002881 [Candidatus Ordinivivax streblomastigis]